MRPGGHEHLVECAQTNKWAGSGCEEKVLSAALSCVKLSVACEEEKEVGGLGRCGAVRCGAVRSGAGQGKTSLHASPCQFLRLNLRVECRDY